MPPSRYELSDEQRKQIEGFFPPYTTGRLSKRSNCEMFNAMLWIARSGALGVICLSDMAFGKQCMPAFVNGAMTGHLF